MSKSAPARRWLAGLLSLPRLPGPGVVTIQVSHGADPEDPDWFVVKPLPGQTQTSMAGTPISNAMAVESLRQAGRTVIELHVEPWQNRRPT